jgi:S-DNA-T family DNA segregation ATPase FtsK/SpoIIIE
MAKRNGRTNGRHKKKEPSEPLVRSETIHSIYAVLAGIAAIFFLLASFGVGGPVGDFLYKTLENLFGVGYFLIPVCLAFLAVGLFRDREPSGFGGVRMLGAVLLFLAGTGLLSLMNEDFGGLAGHWIALPFVKLFETPVAAIILSGIAIVSALLALDTPLTIPNFPGFALPFGKKKTEEREKEIAITGYTEEGDEERPEDENDEEAPVKTKQKEKKPAPAIADTEIPERIGFALKDTAYNPPPISILERDKGKPEVGDIKANANIIKRTLQNFGIVVEMDEVSIGPTVTQYALKPAEGVRLQKIVALQNNLELALAAHPVRIEAPIPGKSLVGIEVPNAKKATVGLASLLSDEKFQNGGHPLLVALGRDIAGSANFANVAKMPHILIAGATGSGKSVAVHAIIASLLYRNGPATLRFIMIDPKRVELTMYNAIPHLLSPVITDPKKAILALKWAGKEMERRYDILEKSAVRDVQSYHENIVQNWKPGTPGEAPDQMPYIVVVIDEIADIMQSYPRELEAAVVRLAQMSRAVGIHLILSTQRPSVNVITGLIKANVPARIALQVASQVDSRTIIDTAGAEKLLGAGDMLFQSAEMSKPRRIQTAFITETEVKNIVEFIKKHNEPSVDFITLTADAGGSPNAIFSGSLEDDVDDELLQEAQRTVEEAGKASTSFLQRKLRIGYARAARIMDILEEKGVIGPADGARPRDVLTTSGGSSNQGADA